MNENSTPEQYSKEALKAYEKGDYPTAVELFSTAAQMYQENQDALNAAEMANNQSVALLKSGRAQEAYEAARDTDKIFAAAEDTRRQAFALGNQAAALKDLGEFESSLQMYEECSALLKEIGEKEFRAIVLQNISELQLKTGKQLQALASMDAALNQKNKLSLKEKFLKKLLKVPFQTLKK